MNEIIQYTLAGIIIATAVFAALRTVYRTVREKKTVLNNCAGCKLQSCCKKPERVSNRACHDKENGIKGKK